MRSQTKATGAMPGAGAMPEQVYPVGPAWAPYRVPFPGVNSFTSSRGVGIVFEGEGDGGSASGGEGGTGATPPAGAPPATGEEQLGEAGKVAIQREREAARIAKAEAVEAKRQLDELRAAGQTDQEKAIAKARAEAQAEIQGKADARVRLSEVRRALTAAGCIDADVAARSPEFADLKVDDEGLVPDLDKTLDAYKKAHGALFARQAAGSGDGGAHGNPPKKAGSLEEAVGAHYTK